MWQEQLISIVEGNSLDPDHIADLLVAYEAETGDPSLRGCGEVLMFVGALRPGSGSWVGPGSGSAFRFGSRSGSAFRFGSRSGSRSVFRSGSWSGSRSGSKSGSGSRFRSRSRSK
jgi:hypothetical protein